MVSRYQGSGEGRAGGQAGRSRAKSYDTQRAATGSDEARWRVFTAGHPIPVAEGTPFELGCPPYSLASERLLVGRAPRPRFKRGEPRGFRSSYLQTRFAHSSR